MSGDMLAPVSAAAVGRGDAQLPRHTAAVGIAQITGQGIAVITAVLLARRLGVAGFGVYAFVSSAVFIVNVATTFGTDMVLIREVAQDRRLDRCSAALGLQLTLSVAAITLILAISAIVAPLARDFVVPLRVFSLSLLPAAWFSVGSALLRGLGSLRAYAGLVIAASALPLVAVVGFVRHGDTLLRTMTILLLAQIGVALAALACCAKPLRDARIILRASPAEIVAMARASRTIGGLGLLGVLYQRLATLGVSVLVGPTATGWYSGASRIVEGSKVGHTALATATYPVMAAAGGHDDAVDRTAVVRRSWRACLVLGVAVSLVLIVAGNAVIDRVYGPEFVNSRHAVTILALGVVPSTIATFQSLAYLAQHREREVLRVLGGAVAVLALGIAVLVPVLGWIGACWAMLIADIAQAAVLTARRGAT